ncbi:MAG: septal ring lytic transglycosylase RlpA family protein [Solirubrobacteraceae bacterium]
MTTRSIATLCALLCAAAATQAPAAVAQQADGGPSLLTRPGALLGHLTAFRGSLDASNAGRSVALQRQQPDGSWRQLTTATAAPDGSFVARWRADALGPATVRAIVAGAGAQAASNPLTATLTVYRAARATYYGPGLYGKRTACGQRLSHALLGVAHKTLPCGTPVAVYYRGRTVTVPVIDRGPFANGAKYDLTQAAATALGMTGTSTVGVMAQRGGHMDPPAPAPAPSNGDAATGGASAGQG